jgi:hypothetical protein
MCMLFSLMQVCERYKHLVIETQAKAFLSAQNNELIVNYKYLCHFSC